MTGVITDACIKCKHMSCVEVCPVDAFYEGENMLVIGPLECVDCGCCIEKCPISAIAFDTDPVAQPWIALNATYSKLWPNVTRDGGQTPVDAEQFQAVEGKFDAYFSPAPGKGDIGRTNQNSKNGCSHCGKESVLAGLIRKVRGLLT